MEIIWHGNSCFSINENKTSVLINPEKSMGKMTADIVLTSLKGVPDTVEGAKKEFDCPGEYEIQGIHIFGYPAWTKSKTEEEKAEIVDPTIIFSIEIDGIRICHLGDLGHSLPSDTLKEIGDVDVLLINTGEKSNLILKKGMELIESIDPRVIIPMGDYAKEDFLKEYGLENLEEIDKYVLKGRSSLPEEETKIVFLKKV